DAARAPNPVPAAAEAAAAVLVHCRSLIDAAGPACVAVKPQLACFERLGSAGWLALEATCAHARTQGLLVLADAKRGDVPATAPAFAPGRAAGLVTASRSIANAYEQHGGTPADAARTEAERLREVAWDLV